MRQKIACPGVLAVWSIATVQPAGTDGVELTRFPAIAISRLPWVGAAPKVAEMDVWLLLLASFAVWTKAMTAAAGEGASNATAIAGPTHRPAAARARVSRQCSSI